MREAAQPNAIRKAIPEVSREAGEAVPTAPYSDQLRVRFSRGSSALDVTNHALIPPLQLSQLSQCT